jgi:hypothetical protein
VVAEDGRRVYPEDGQDYLRGLAHSLARGTYSTAIFVEGDEGLTDEERVARAHAQYPVYMGELRGDDLATSPLEIVWPPDLE